MASKIEWLQSPDGTKGESWNPITGCTKIATGCKNCYAERMAKRLNAMHQPPYEDVVDENGWTGKLYFVDSALEKPLKWKKPRRIFLESMGDLFHRDVPDEWRDRILTVIALASRHTIITTTKRAELMQRYMASLAKSIKPLEQIARELGYTFDYGGIPLLAWPLPNLHLGISVSTQGDLEKNIGYLHDTPATVRWLSIEPMLGPINLTSATINTIAYPWSMQKLEWKTNLLTGKSAEGMGPNFKHGLDWIVIGCESGPNRRPMKIEWAYDVVRQCRDAGVACFVKQLDIGGKVVTDMREFPEGLQVRELSR